MSRFVPPAADLAQAVANYLEEQLLPTLDGYHRFQTRVCVNALRILQRELNSPPDVAQADHARLRALLGEDGPADALDAQLADRIADGRIGLDDPALQAHLRQSLRDALAVNHPGWEEAG